MKTKILLSVIIPCFNNGEYVYDCLNSLPISATDLIEVIVVNDGSTDNSESEIERFKYSHENISSNVLLINQKNQGVSIARNNGIKHANGKYIAFLDADDLWTPSLWETIKPVMLDNKPDMIIFNASRFYNDNPKETSHLSVTNLDNGYHTVNQLSDLSGIFEKNSWFSWCRVYKKELFNDIEFPCGREYEDLAIIPVITAKIKNIFSISASLILYRTRSTSITGSPKEKHIDDVMYAMESLYSIYSNSNKSDSVINMLAKTMEHEYSLLRSINKKVRGYCHFNNTQIKNIKYLLKPFQNEFKLSMKLKTKFIWLYSKIEEIKNH